jgi:GxxExxY protein
VRYREITLDCGYRIDLLVADALIVEVKSVVQLAPIHDAQVISYLRLSHLTLALLINFNVRVLKQGIKRLVNGFPQTTIVPQERPVRYEEMTHVRDK